MARTASVCMRLRFDMITKHLQHGLVAAALLCCFAAGCSKNESVPGSGEEREREAKAEKRAEPEPDAGPPAPEIDACTLVSDDEFETITGGHVQSRKPSQGVTGGLRISQCYVEMPSAAESIAYAVFQRGDASAPSPRAVWKQTFERDFDKEPEGEGKGEEEKSPRPQELPGIGEKAFIMPQRFGAAIYVLNGNAYVRLSNGGGPADVPEKSSRHCGRSRRSS